MPDTPGRCLPLVLGVTAHRDLRPADEPALRAAVRRIVEGFHRKCPHTPVMVLSALAEGGDMLCAEAALEAGVEVLASLPFPPAVYLATGSFRSAAARQRFDALVAREGVRHFVTPAPADGRPESDADWAGVAADPGTRQMAYAANGAFIARNSHALVALWAGEQPRSPSGAADVVMSQLKGLPPSALSRLPGFFHWPETGLVMHVWAPREASGPAAAGHLAGEQRELWIPEDVGPAEEALGGKAGERAARRRLALRRSFGCMCANLDRANERLAAPRAPSPEGGAEPLAMSYGGPPAHSREALRRLAWARESVGRLAAGRSALLDWGIVAVFGSILLAAVAFQLYVEWYTIRAGLTVHEPLLLVLFLLSLAAGGGLVLWLRGVENDELDYRSLAEALRVACQWGNAGLEQRVSDCYLQQLRSELTWTRKAVQALLLTLPEERPAFRDLDGDAQLRCLDAVRTKWVRGQIRFFADRFRDFRLKGRWCRLGGLALAVAGGAFAAAQFAIPAHVPDALAPASATGGPSTSQQGIRDWPPWVSAEHPIRWMVVGGGLIILAGGLAITFGERRLYEELARQYTRTLALFRTADTELKRLLDQRNVPAAQRLLFELGREALTENANWLVLRRSRPVEMIVH